MRFEKKGICCNSPRMMEIGPFVRKIIIQLNHERYKGE